jgi:hypothetical protein
VRCELYVGVVYYGYLCCLVGYGDLGGYWGDWKGCSAVFGNGGKGEDGEGGEGGECLKYSIGGWLGWS